MARLDRGPVSGAAYGPDMPAIEVRSLSFAYPDADAAVLEGLDWSVPQGAFALLVGGTGSGKSTLLSLLKPEIAPAGERTGELLVLGENVADMDVRASAERVGYVFQDPENQIVCETVWHEMAFGLENLGLARDEMRRRVAETSYFFGLEDWLHRDTDTLSGGRKQLLSLAAVLTLRPRVLLLDEPTSQLDPVAEKNFLHALFRVNRELGCTVVVATHQPRPMLEYATCAYRIEDGRVREVADMASLGRRESLFSDDMLGWGAIRCANKGVFSRREDNLGSLERIEREKKFGIGQIIRICGANVARERLGSLLAHGWKQNTPKNARRVGYHPVGRLVSLRSSVRLGAARARCFVFGWRGACNRGRQRMR